MVNLSGLCWSGSYEASHLLIAMADAFCILVEQSLSSDITVCCRRITDWLLLGPELSNCTVQGSEVLYSSTVQYSNYISSSF